MRACNAIIHQFCLRQIKNLRNGFGNYKGAMEESPLRMFTLNRLLFATLGEMSVEEK
jgi:hypothetical protein